jgi:hypothetical protein
VADGKAWQLLVEIGARDGQRVEIRKKQARPAPSAAAGQWHDWTGDEEVVTGNLGSLTDGRPVTVAGRP